MEGLVLGDAGFIAMTILWLVFIEGLLSADNALVLATMVRHLPKAEQKRALRYGIWGAFVFRVIGVILAGVLIRFWYLKVLGGAYLLYLAGSHFLLRGGHELDSEGAPKRRRLGSSFWGTVVSVELADIAFSIDSILAAVALAQGIGKRFGENLEFAVIITGGILGIVTMRFVAGYFIILLDRFKGLEPAAYALVAWIGMKLVVGGLHTGHHIQYELPENIFWGGMLVIVILGFLMGKEPKKTEASEAAFLRDTAESFGGFGTSDDGPSEDAAATPETSDAASDRKD